MRSLYFEGDRFHQYRILRAVKNRFGSTDEVGVFEMAEPGCGGAQPVRDLPAGAPGNGPGRRRGDHQGSRPILVEVQALTRDAPTACRGGRPTASTATACRCPGRGAGKARRPAAGRTRTST